MVQKNILAQHMFACFSAGKRSFIWKGQKHYEHLSKAVIRDVQRRLLVAGLEEIQVRMGERGGGGGVPQPRALLVVWVVGLMLTWPWPRL